MTPEEHLIADARQLIKRLERLSADSVWARRASGCRGALLKVLDASGVLEASESPAQTTPLDTQRLQYLMQFGYEMLEKAAREIPYRP